MNQPITDQEKRLAAIAYLFGFVSGFFVLLVEKESHFVRFHALQSVFTFLVLFLLTVVLEFIPIVGPIGGSLVVLFSGLYGLFLVNKAITGEYYKVPHLGEIVENQV